MSNRPTATNEVYRYTTAPSDYDGFGVTGHDVATYCGKTVRAVAIPSKHLTWYDGRIGSGMHPLWTMEQWEEVVDCGRVEFLPAQKAKESIPLPKIDCDVSEQYHTRRKLTFWIVVPREKGTREQYETLRAECEVRDGWYSRKWGKLPGGYAFGNEADAREFARDLEPDSKPVEMESPKPIGNGSRAGLDCERCFNAVDNCICNPKCAQPVTSTALAIVTTSEVAKAVVGETVTTESKAAESEPLPDEKQASFIIDRLSLKRALQRLATTAPRRSAKTVLSSVKISINGYCELSACDLEQWHDERLEAEYDGEHDVIVDARSLKKIVDKSRTDQLSVELWDKSLHVAGAILPLTDDVDNWPTAESITDGEFETLASWSGSAAELASMIDRTHYAAGEDSERYTLGAILCEFSGSEDKLTMVGTDGRRLAVARHGSAIADDDKLVTGMLASSFAKSALKALKQADSVTLSITKDVKPMVDADGNVRHEKKKDKDGKAANEDTDRPLFHEPILRLTCISSDNITSYLYRQVDGKFPRWRSIVPNPELLCEIDAKAFFAFADTVAGFATDEEKYVDFSISNGFLSANCSNESGTFSDRIEVRNATGEFSILLNAEFVLGFARSVKNCGESIRILGTDEDSPIVLQADNALCVIMSMARKEK